MKLETIVSGAGGRWSCDRFPPKLNAVWIEVRHPASWSTTFKTDGNSDWARKAQINLADAVRVLSVLPAADLTGTVTSVDGLPVAGAEVSMMPKAALPVDCADALPPPDGPRATAKTDAQGRYTMRWCDAGKFLLLVFPPAGVPRRLELQTVQAMRTQDVTLTTGRSIAGRIANEGGEPVAGVPVRLCGWGGDGLAVEKVVATTDRDGRFEWTSAPAESVMLRFAHDGYFDRCVTVEANAEPLRVRMFQRGRK